MEPTLRAPGPGAPRWIGLVAVLALAGGLAVAARQWSAGRTAPTPLPSAPPSAIADTLEDLVSRALKQAGGEDEKSRWVDELQEVDLAALDQVSRVIFLRHANTRRCTCGCGYTLAACRIYDSSCPKSPPRVRALYDSVAHGLIVDASGLRERPERGAAALGER